MSLSRFQILFLGQLVRKFTYSNRIGLLTFGIFHWHKEELAISAQMVKRERVFREHRLFDALIPLGSAGYLREQLKLALKEARTEAQPLSLVAIDIDHFSQINQLYGHQEGDAVLQSITQLLLLNLREQDLLCRLAGDRFVALLPNTNEYQAEIIALELKMRLRIWPIKARTLANVSIYQPALQPLLVCKKRPIHSLKHSTANLVLLKMD